MRDKPLLYENTIRNIKYTQWELSIWMSDLNGNNNNHKQYMNREPCRKMPEQKQEREKLRRQQQQQQRNKSVQSCE